MKTRKHFPHLLPVLALVLSGLAGLIGYHWIRPTLSPLPDSSRAAAKGSGTNAATLRGQEAIEHLKQQGQYESLTAAMTATKYKLRWEEQTGMKDASSAWHAPNPAQALDAYFTPEQVHLSARTGEARAALALAGYGYGERIVKLAPGEMSAQENRVSYRRVPQEQSAVGSRQRGVEEWYINKAEGLEQGFTVEAPPAVESRGERLRVTMALTGDLHARLEDGGKTIELVNRHGVRVMSYGGLLVKDAVGRELPARLTAAGDEVAIEVDDQGAAYPVLIDPTFYTQQQKLTASDGAAGDAFGRSVALSGDTALIGAYLDNVGGNADQGSAYVFVRSGTTWTQQAKLIASDGALNGTPTESVHSTSPFRRLIPTAVQGPRLITSLSTPRARRSPSVRRRYRTVLLGCPITKR